MTNEQIKEILLANGFRERQQPDGSMDLNPYVYDAAKNLIAVTLNKVQTKLAHVVDPYNTVASKGIIDSFDDILESCIDEVWSGGFSNWISVEDRLPTDDQRYLVAGSYGFMYVKQFVPQLNVFDTALASKITHWMPLPERPSEVSDDI